LVLNYSDKKKNALISIQNSKLFFQNCSFNENVIHNAIFIESIFSFLNFSLCVISENKFYENSHFIDQNAFLIIEKSSILDNFFEKSLIFCVPSKETAYTKEIEFFLFIISSSNFLNNSANILIYLDGGLFEVFIIFIDLFIESNSFTNALLLIKEVNYLNFTHVVFKENFSKALIQIQNSDFLFIDKFSCVSNNKKIDKISKIKEFCKICGSCLNIDTFKYILFQNSQIKDCFSEITPPGLIMMNPDKKKGRMHIFQSIFAANSFESSQKDVFFGTATYFFNIEKILISNCFFYNNSIYLLKIKYGGPSIVSISQKGTLKIIDTIFERNRALRGSLSIEFIGSNLTVKNSTFIRLSQYDFSFSYQTSVLVIGRLSYLNVIKCIFENNQASSGLFYLSDKNLTTIMLDNIILIENFASFTPGIYIVSETMNKLIIWKNSLIVNHKFSHDSLLLYLYITTPIVQFEMLFLNNNITNNRFLPTNTAFRNMLCMWGYSNNITFRYENNSFMHNENIWVFFSIFGIKPILTVFVRQCLLFNNSAFAIFAADHAIISCFQTKIVNTSLMNGFLIRALSINLKLIEVFLENTTEIGESMIFISDSSMLMVVNVSVLNIDGQIELIKLDKMKYTFFYNVYFHDISCDNLIKIVNSIYNYFKYLFLISIKTRKIVKINTSYLKIRKIYLEKRDSKYIFYAEKDSFFNVSYLYEIAQKNHSENNGVLLIQDSSFFFTKTFMNLSRIILKNRQILSFSSNITISFSLFFSILSKEPLIFMEKGLLFLKNMTISYCSLFMNLEKAKIIIINSSFFNSIQINTIQKHHFIFNNSIHLFLIQSTFENISGFSSPLAIINSIPSNNFTIFRCKFKNLSSENSNGGTIFTSDLKLKIKDTIFYKNFAYVSGGALYLHCKIININLCFYQLENNSFVENKAKNSGGAYKWEYLKPIEKNNDFTQNLALNLNNFVSFFCKFGFELISIENDKEKILFSSFRENSTDMLILQNLSRLSKNFYLKFYPLDSINQILIQDDQFPINIFLYESNMMENGQFCNGRIFGKTSQLLDLGENAYIFNDVNIKSCPNSLVSLNFSYNFQYFPNEVYEIFNSLNEKRENGHYSVIIPFLTPSCQKGEIFNEKILFCESCKENYYSLSITDTKCYSCPLNAFCPGGEKIEVEVGFWRLKNSINIYECSKNLMNCLGGDPSLCAENYQGILCSECKLGLHKNYIGTCEDCPNFYLNIIANMVFYLFLMMVFTWALFYYKSRRLNKNKKNMLKFVIDYVHLLFLTQKYDLNPLKSSLEIYMFLRMSLWFSIDCFFSLIVTNEDFLLTNVLKFIAIYLSFLMICIAGKIVKKNRFSLKKMFFTLYYAIYPFFIMFSFENIYCESIEGTDVLKASTKINCSEKGFLLFLSLLYVPNIFLFILFIPTAYILKKYMKKYTKMKNNLQKYSIQSISLSTFLYKSNFFTHNFKEIIKEIVNFFEKITLMILQVYIYSENTKLLSVFATLLFFFLLQITFYEFSQKKYKTMYFYKKSIFIINVYFSIVLNFFYEQNLAIFLILIVASLKGSLYIIVLKDLFRKTRIVDNFRIKLKLKFNLKKKLKD